MDQTVDNAFISSTLALPIAPTEVEIVHSTECISFILLTVVAVVTFIILIRTLIDIVPSMLASLIRWKESLNLEASNKLSNDRNFVAAGLIIPFCLIVYSYQLYQPAFLEGVGPNIKMWVIIGVFSLFIAVRTLLEYLLKPRRVQAKTYKGIVRVAYSFFIIMTLLLLLTSGISAVFGLEKEGVRIAMLWISAAIYFIYLIRKIQIFTSSCSIFVGFLYLCALEILPTGVLIASAVIF